MAEKTVTQPVSITTTEGKTVMTVLPGSDSRRRFWIAVIWAAWLALAILVTVWAAHDWHELWRVCWPFWVVMAWCFPFLFAAFDQSQRQSNITITKEELILRSSGPCGERQKTWSVRKIKRIVSYKSSGIYVDANDSSDLLINSDETTQTAVFAELNRKLS